MASDEDSTKSYRIKDIRFFGSARRILLQSANGPCPLLALCNVLLLRNQLSISQDARYISFAELVEMVSNHLFDVNAASGGDSTSSRAANVREHLSSCLEILPRLNVGLDVNCKFSSVSDFEYTQELAVFDLLDICLYHGWLVSRHDEKAWTAFAHLSYNQVVERLIAFHEAQQKVADAANEGESGGTGETEAKKPEQVVEPETAKVLEEGLLIQDFMDRTASQLSYDGLSALHETVRERQLAVFFRNSHFNAMLKFEGSLYLLCTDIAFGHSHIVWERLDEVDGDTAYCDADFKENTARSDESVALAAAEAVQESYLASAVAGPPQGEDISSDAMLAWQMQQEDLRAHQAARAAAAHHPPQSAARAGVGGAGGGASGQGGTGSAGAVASAPSAGAPPAEQGASGAANSNAKSAKKSKGRGKSCCVQ